MVAAVAAAVDAHALATACHGVSDLAVPRRMLAVEVIAVLGTGKPHYATVRKMAENRPSGQIYDIKNRISIFWIDKSNYDRITLAQLCDIAVILLKI